MMSVIELSGPHLNAYILAEWPVWFSFMGCQTLTRLSRMSDTLCHWQRQRGRRRRRRRRRGLKRQWQQPWRKHKWRHNGSYLMLGKQARKSDNLPPSQLCVFPQVPIGTGRYSIPSMKSIYFGRIHFEHERRQTSICLI